MGARGAEPTAPPVLTSDDDEVEGVAPRGCTPVTPTFVRQVHPAGQDAGGSPGGTIAVPSGRMTYQ
jgi:hypothetical protein